MFHVKVASLKLPVVIIYDALSPEIDLFQNGSLCEFWKIASAPERNFSGDPPGAFAVHTQLGKYNHRHRLHHHNQHKHNHHVISLYCKRDFKSKIQLILASQVLTVVESFIAKCQPRLSFCTVSRCESLKNEKCCWMIMTEMKRKLDPVCSTVRYEMMKLCTGSVEDTMGR